MRIVFFLLAAVALFGAEAADTSARGKLTLMDGKPALESKAGLVWLDGDTETMAVLKDKRLSGSDLEVRGQFRDKDHFTVDHFHNKAMFVYKDGKRKTITYWCDVCSIRTYTPGICWCCQEETALDLRDPEEK